MHEEAEASGMHGIELVREHGLQEGVDVLVYGSMAMYLLRHDRPADDIIAEGRALDPEYFTLHLADAQQHRLHRQWPEAEAILRGLIAEGDREVNHRVLAFSRSIFTRLPWEMLAECLFEQGRFQEAAEAYGQAAEHGANELEMRTKAAVSRSLASQHQQLGA